MEGGSWSVWPDRAIFESSWQQMLFKKVAQKFGELLGLFWKNITFK